MVSLNNLLKILSQLEPNRYPLSSDDRSKVERSIMTSAHETLALCLRKNCCEITFTDYVADLNTNRWRPLLRNRWEL